MDLYVLEKLEAGYEGIFTVLNKFGPDIVFRHEG